MEDNPDQASAKNPGNFVLFSQAILYLQYGEFFEQEFAG